VILGGGTGGTLTASRLRKIYRPDETTITVVDQSDEHIYQPGLLFVPFGVGTIEDITRPRRTQLHHDIHYSSSGVTKVELASNTVRLADGSRLEYDVMVISTGATLATDETEGLTGPGWMEKVFTFYTPEGAIALAIFT
jgi:sulfide:quinone oxidoreductase